jgi:hypothetical protein
MLDGYGANLTQCVLGVGCKVIGEFMRVDAPSNCSVHAIEIAQQISAFGVVNPRLRSEIYCQLCKQTNRNPNWYARDAVTTTVAAATESSSSGGGGGVEIATNTDWRNRAHTIKGWELFAVVVDSFLPEPGLEPYLRKYFYDNLEARPPSGAQVQASCSTKVSIYASYCLRRYELNHENQLQATNLDEHAIKMAIVCCWPMRRQSSRGAWSLELGIVALILDGVLLAGRAIHQDVVRWIVGEVVRNGCAKT